MTNTVFALLAVVVAVIVIAFLLRRSVSDRGDWPFYAKKPLSHPEQVLYHRLVKSLPECIVLAQVQVSRLIGVKKGYNFHQWNNRINRLSVDYVVCKKDSTIIAAIELDDSSHQKLNRRETDRKKDRAFKAAGVPLMRWSVKALPDESAIRAALAAQAQSSEARLADSSVRVEPFIGPSPMTNGLNDITGRR
jgi:very-short-patch-repair endonuclease